MHQTGQKKKERKRQQLHRQKKKLYFWPFSPSNKATAYSTDKYTYKKVTGMLGMNVCMLFLLFLQGLFSPLRLQ